MKFVLDKYTRLYEAIGGYVQYDKTSFWSQRQKRVNGNFIIENKSIELKINDKGIQQKNPIKAERTLGVYISPNSNQQEQFKK